MRPHAPAVTALAAGATAAVAVLVVAGCGQDEPSPTAPRSASSSGTAGPADGVSPSPTQVSMNVARTQRLVLGAQRRFSSELDARRRQNGGTYPDRESITAAFEAVPHSEDVYLTGFTLNRTRTAISYCLRALNDKSSITVADGRGEVAVLTDRDCGGDSDLAIVGP